MKNAGVLWRVLDVLAAGVVLVGLGLLCYNLVLRDGGTGVEGVRTAPQAVAEQHEFLAKAADGQWIGPRDAPVVAIIYSSYSCAFAAELQDTLLKLRQTYPQHFAYVVKHYVAPTSPDDFVAAVAAECAGEQGRFESFHKTAFRRAGELSSTSGWLRVAEEVEGLHRSAFEECVHTRRPGERIARQKEEAREAGIRGTPGILLANEAIEGALPFEDFRAIVGARLREAWSSR